MRGKRWKVRHCIGHGLGKRVHERVEKTEPGMVLAIEPGIYIKEYAGFRVEDTILIRRRKIEVLSGSITPKLRTQ